MLTPNSRNNFNPTYFFHVNKKKKGRENKKKNDSNNSNLIFDRENFLAGKFGRRSIGNSIEVGKVRLGSQPLGALVQFVVNYAEKIFRLSKPGEARLPSIHFRFSRRSFSKNFQSFKWNEWTDVPGNCTKCGLRREMHA